MGERDKMRAGATAIQDIADLWHSAGLQEAMSSAYWPRFAAAPPPARRRPHSRQAGRRGPTPAGAANPKDSPGAVPTQRPRASEGHVEKVAARTRARRGAGRHRG